MAALTAEETELYDRQIRAWGVESQKRMRNSKILLVGLDGAGSETLKNLVLAGLGNITILENRTVTPQLIETHFYLTSAHLTQPAADIAYSYFSAMNPNIALHTNTADPFTLNDAYFKVFDVVVVSNHARALQLRIDAVCNAAQIGFFSSRSIGHLGYAFADLQRHKYQLVSPTPQKKKSKSKSDEKAAESESEKESTERIESGRWYSLSSALSVSATSLKKQTRGKKRRYRTLLFALQALEQTEDAILQREKNFVGQTQTQSREEMVRQAMLKINDEQSPEYKLFSEISAKVRGSGQFLESDVAESASASVVRDVLRVWNLSVCPSNAILGGYLANFVMFYVQRKRKPLRNWLWFDLWGCEATEIVMRSAEDEERDQKEEADKKREVAQSVREMLEVQLKGKKSAMEVDVDEKDGKEVDGKRIAKLTVHSARENVVSCLSSDEEDENQDIDLID